MTRVSRAVLPSRQLELELLEDHSAVVGMDEVGRGSLAGPLAVGATLVHKDTGPAPAGLADSKLLSHQRRMALVGPVRQWVSASAVGWASPDEISTFGVTAALRFAGLRALGLLSWARRLEGACVLLDGSHDWLGPSQADLFAKDEPYGLTRCTLPVVTRVKADRDASVVAAASVLAKVARDHHMSSLPDPGYDWAANKGYASRSHVEALRVIGPCHRHRLGWKLPGMEEVDSER